MLVDIFISTNEKVFDDRNIHIIYIILFTMLYIFHNDILPFQKTYPITIMSNQRRGFYPDMHDNNAGCTLQKWIFSKFDVVLVLLLTHFHNMCVAPNDCRKGV